MADKIYVPKCYATERPTKFGPLLSIDFNVDELIKFAQQHKTDRGYLKLTVSPKKNPDERSTHSVFLNDWKPQQGQQRTEPRKSNSAYPNSPIDTSDVPPNDDSSVPF